MREEGYYWIKTAEKGKWLVAEFDGHNWWLPGQDGTRDEQCFFKINENRIKTDEG